MKVLFDTNVVLDFLLDREPFASAAADLSSAVERRVLAGVLGATTVTTLAYLAYLAAKAVGHKPARQQIAGLLTLFEIAPVTGDVLRRAVESRIQDFEDAVLVEAARGVGTHAIVTRDAADFRAGGLTLYAPEELLRALSAG